MKPTSQPSKKKILIIDDEIEGISLKKALTTAKTFFEALRDPDSEIREEMDNFLNKHQNQFQNKLETDGTVHEAFFKEVILSDSFKNSLSTVSLTYKSLSSLYQENEWLLRIKGLITKAFPTDVYDVKYLENVDNINIDELDQFDLLIVDWFLENGYSQSSDLLLKLSEKDNLPAIILLTSHENILESNTKSDFYIKTRISGAGLTILIKKEIRAESFGYIGLRMLAEKAIKQRPIANASRHYIKQWENVLESAKQNTIKSLWQLDTFIMKSIHTDAISDSQPYSNHFHDFISREHSWHMETNTTLNTYAENLGTALNEHNYNDLLTHHSNEDSITLHRELLQHYSFQGGVNTFKIHDITKDELQQKILEKLPFGAVLVHGDNSTSDSYEAFVNITQPCDLSGLIRNQPNNSLIFMTLSLKKRLVKNSMFFDTSTYHIYGLTLNDTLYDMIPKNKQLVGINFNEFYQKFNNYKLVGVLRNDITMSLQQSTAASIIRPSQPRTNRPCFGLAKLFLISCSSTGEKKCISFGRVKLEVRHKPPN